MRTDSKYVIGKRGEGARYERNRFVVVRVFVFKLHPKTRMKMAYRCATAGSCCREAVFRLFLRFLCRVTCKVRYRTHDRPPTQSRCRERSWHILFNLGLLVSYIVTTAGPSAIS